MDTSVLVCRQSPNRYLPHRSGSPCSWTTATSLCTSPSSPTCRPARSSGTDRATVTHRGARRTMCINESWQALHLVNAVVHAIVELCSKSLVTENMPFTDVTCQKHTNHLNFARPEECKQGKLLWDGKLKGGLD